MIQNNEKLIIKSSEIRAVEPTDDNNDPTSKQLEGYALMFNSPSKDLGKFIETIDPQALQDTDLSQVLFLNDHNFNQPIAKVGSGLTLDVDDKGLHFVVDIDDSVSYEADLYNLIQKGVVTSMSFGFELPDDGSGEAWTEDTATGVVTRTITYIQTLYEISAVSIPAYAASTVATRGYDSFINNNQKGEDTSMTKQTIIDPAQNGEVRSFDNYIRSQGEVRDGLTTDQSGVLIPSEIITPIFKSKKGTNRLSDYATVKQVSVGQGSYPIAGNDPSKVLATKAENAAIGDVDPEVTGVEFKTETRAGKVYLSQELVDDNAINFSTEIQAQMQKLITNTDNAQIVAKLKTLTPVVVKDVDGIKQAKNTKLDPSLQPVVVVNQSAFNWLDTQKDSEGRYLMSEDIQAPTGRSLFGLPVVELSDAVLPNVAAGKFSMFIGDLAETIAVFRRNQVTTKWQQFDSYSQGLAIMLRNDYEFIDKTATVALTIDTTAA
ncbi:MULTISPECIES: phage major capsid protein [Lactiplantibacillus]|uniref:phage major capsid protein n=1 Tax=Lactiplantibacillus TaxID=2767842 RepID=UPI001D09789D|nr:phage major capsid protein [Lactiplantibacillus argentoratensis]MCB7464035.1 phage major capsid protein [Lactiplantibacillus argentoratensis]